MGYFFLFAVTPKDDSFDEDIPLEDLDISSGASRKKGNRYVVIDYMGHLSRINYYVW